MSSSHSGGDEHGGVRTRGTSSRQGKLAVGELAQGRAQGELKAGWATAGRARSK